MLPWGVLTIGAIVLAAIFASGVGRPRGTHGPVRRFILRWFHSITWILLAACFGSLASGATLPIDPPTLALLALGVYIVFIAALMSAAGDRQRSNR